MERALAKDLSIAYQRAGNGPALVLLHGFSLDSRSWKPQIGALSDQFTVIAWDAPGAGQSQDPPAPFGIADWADALAGLLDIARIERAHLVGISWGGLLAQEFYRHHASRVTSLVLAGTYAGWKGSLPEAVAEQRLENALVDSTAAPGAFVHKYLPDMFGDAATSEMRHDLAAIMADFHPAGFRQMATALARADTRQLLPTINVPTLLVWGDADKRSPLHVAHAMRDAIPGARLQLIAGAGHLSNLEQPTDFTTIVRNFCEQSESMD